MMQRLAAMLMTCFLACTATFAAEKEPQEIDVEITRFLMALDFGKVMKDAIVAGIPEADRNDPTARALMQLPEQRYAAVAAPLFRSELTLEGARKIVQFYTSETMRKVRASQNAQGVDAAIVVTPAEFAEYEAFMKTEHGRAALRIGESFGEPQFQQKFLEALDREISK